MYRPIGLPRRQADKNALSVACARFRGEEWVGARSISQKHGEADSLLLYTLWFCSEQGLFRRPAPARRSSRRVEWMLERTAVLSSSPKDSFDSPNHGSVKRRISTAIRRGEGPAHAFRLEAPRDVPRAKRGNARSGTQGWSGTAAAGKDRGVHSTPKITVL